MSQYFVESKQPIFFSFNQIIQYQKTDLEFDLFINKFQENFEIEQKESWLKYWNKQGEELVLQTWNEKFKNYLKQAQDSSTEKKTDFEKEEETVILDINPQAVKEANITVYENSWDDLWHEHREKIYCEQYSVFITIYYNYFLHLKRSCESSLPIFEGLDEVEENSEYLLSDDNKIKQELEKLTILGLPTAFGGRPQYSSKKQKTCKQSIVNYSDFFSDSEMENDSNASDIDDYEKDLTVEDIVVKEDFLHKVQQKTTTKVQKRKNRKLKNVPAFILEEKGLLKYWRKRFSLFSRFDEGIRLDRESWFSVTPEKIAKHIAERLKCSIIVDGFCGSGGNSIQFALACDKVIAIDIDPVKLEMAKHNAQIYNVSHKIEFILGDFLQLAESGKIKADILFLSPPWGGPKYKNKKEFDIEKYLLPAGASALLETSRNVSQNIALFLPRNSNVKQIVKLAGIGNRCEIEHNFLDSRLVAITALYGEEILTKKDTN